MILRFIIAIAAAVITAAPIVCCTAGIALPCLVHLVVEITLRTGVSGVDPPSLCPAAGVLARVGSRWSSPFCIAPVGYSGHSTQTCAGHEIIHSRRVAGVAYLAPETQKYEARSSLSGANLAAERVSVAENNNFVSGSVAMPLPARLDSLPSPAAAAPKHLAKASGPPRANACIVPTRGRCVDSRVLISRDTSPSPLLTAWAFGATFPTYAASSRRGSHDWNPCMSNRSASSITSHRKCCSVKPPPARRCSTNRPGVATRTSIAELPPGLL
eukprot:scaffold34129_cov32-Tisochrysis_lutea.AAC.8